MRTLVRAVSFVSLVAVLSPCPASAEQFGSVELGRPVQRVSIFKVIAEPEGHKHELMQIAGYLIAGEVVALCPSASDLEYGLLVNCVELIVNYERLGIDLAKLSSYTGRVTHAVGEVDPNFGQNPSRAPGKENPREIEAERGIPFAARLIGVSFLGILESADNAPAVE
jgi:hypothetical protein